MTYGKISSSLTYIYLVSKGEREMGGMKTDGEMDREKANVAKWLIWLKGIWEFLLYTYL